MRTAGSAAKDAEARAVTMVELDRTRGLGEARAHLEALVVGQQRAGDDRWPQRALAFEKFWR